MDKYSKFMAMAYKTKSLDQENLKLEEKLVEKVNEV
jgi:hypothetical protein